MTKHTVNLPFGGGVAFAPAGDAARHQRKVDARAAFVVDYCKTKGWPADPEKLNLAQIMEIRKEAGWQNAGKS